jgi:hypothetical protein
VGSGYWKTAAYLTGSYINGAVSQDEGQTDGGHW